MIYSRFGSPVSRVISGNIQKGEIDCIFYDDINKYSRIVKTYINELKADNGFTEICEAIQNPASYQPTQEELDLKIKSLV